MTIQKKAQQGFTLIELMIVIAIVGILAAIALPAYQDYIVRSKLSEPLAALAEAKTTVAEYVSANGGFAVDSVSYAINTAKRTNSDIIESITIATNTTGARIVANIHTSVYDGSTAPSASFTSFQLSGDTTSDGSLTWVCKAGDDGGANSIPIKYLPANCRG